MATGRTHALSGATFYAGGVVWAAKAGIPLDPLSVLILAPIAAGAALLPDLDHPSATMARTLGPVSRQLARFVSAVGGGHRGLTHSLAGAVLFGALAYVTLGWRDALGGKVGLAFLLFLLISSAVRVWNIRGWVDDAAGAVLGPLLVVLDAPLDGLPVVVAGGCLVHLLGDLPTDRGLPVLWPLPGRVRFPKALTFKVGGRFERKGLFPGLVVALVGVLGWGIGLWAFLWDTFATFRVIPT